MKKLTIIFVSLNIIISVVVSAIYFVFNKNWYSELLLAGVWHLMLLTAIVAVAILCISRSTIKYCSLISPTLILVCFFDGNFSQNESFFFSVGEKPLSAAVNEDSVSVVVAQHNTSKWHAEEGEITAWLDSIAENVDIVFLIEVNPKFRQRLQKELTNTFPYNIFDPHPEKRGQVFLSKIPILEFQWVDSVDPNRDPDLLVTLETPSYAEVAPEQARGQPWYFLGVHPHAPVSEDWFNLRNKGYAKYIDLLNKMDGKPVLVVGDFNATQYSYWFRIVLSDFDLTFNASVSGTAPSSIPRYIGITIDHLLYSKHWRALNRQVGTSYGGSHCTVITELEWLPK